jgi:ferredoxin-NADP reductase
MKVKGFLKDVGGASRVTKSRLASFENASDRPVGNDPIADVARAWHPGKLDLVVSDVIDITKTTKAVRFKRADGEPMQYFYAGQYMVLDFPIGESLISRPYTISSAPCQARGEDGFVEICVRDTQGKGFIADYVNSKVKKGDTFRGLIGCGQFYFEPLRDSRKVVALAGGVGITPFVSMAREVADGKLDIDLTILHGSVTADDIVFNDELEAIEKRCDRVKLVNILSEGGSDWKGESGFIDARRIRKYSPAGVENTTYFVCGPQLMYGFIEKALDELDVPKRRRRFEVFGQAADVTELGGYPEEMKDKTDTAYELTVVRGISETVIPAKAGESLVVSLERAGIRIETGCRSGECGFCRTKVLSGNVFISPKSDGLRGADRDFGYVHACAAYPLSDVKIRIPIA